MGKVACPTISSKQSGAFSTNELGNVLDSAIVGSGTLRDQVKFTYDAWGNLFKYEQDNDSAVGAGGGIPTYPVEYAWAHANKVNGRKTIRCTQKKLPSGTTIDYEYLSTGGFFDDDVSRVTRVKDQLCHRGPADEGDWDGSGISNRSRRQTWTLDQLGNWDHVTLDHDGNGTYGGAGASPWAGACCRKPWPQAATQQATASATQDTSTIPSSQAASGMCGMACWIVSLEGGRSTTRLAT